MAIQRRVTKGPGQTPARPPARTPQRVQPPVEEAESDDGDSEEEAEPAPQPKRRTPSGRRRAGTSGTRQAVPEPQEEEASGEEAPNAKNRGSEVGNLRLRGMSLAWKIGILTVVITGVVSLIFAFVAINKVKTQALDNIKRAGYQQALTLHAFGQRVVAPLKGKHGPSFDKALRDYLASPESAGDKVLIAKILSGDSRIKDIAIFASQKAADVPDIAVLRGDPEAKDFTIRPQNEVIPVENGKADADVQIYGGKYGGEEVLFFRVPLEKDPAGKLFSSASLILSSSQIDSEVSRAATQLLILAGVLGVLGFGAALGLGRYLAVRPMNNLVSDINEVATGNLDHESLVATQTADEIGMLAMAFNRMTKNLREARELERDSERIAGELNTAKAIHAKLMPEKLPQLPGIDVFTAYHCAKEVGGDYYDFIPVDAENLALCVADVSGKGIPGSMVMGTTRTILRMMAVGNLSASDVLSKTNFHVALDIKRGMFVTCVYAILNLRSRELTVASAGHNPMLIWRAATGKIEKVRPNGIALGFDKGPIFNRTVREQKVKLLKGDRVVLYTDGVVESMNEEREEWGDDALDEFTLKNSTLPSKEYVRLLLKALEEHQGSAEQHDDITITTFRIG